MTTAETPAVALTIAGSDSGAGAGLQADLKSMAARGAYGTTAITAVTAQNTAAVREIYPLPVAMIEAQISAVTDDMDVRAVKTGLLGRAEVIHLVARLVDEGRLVAPVVDPVAVASSGRVFLDPEGVDAYRSALVPLARLVTPNLWEAALLADVPVEALVDATTMIEAAERIRALGAEYVLVKGGHLPGVETHDDRPAPDEVIDVLVGPEGPTILVAPHVPTANTHGTGCSLSAAITAELAKGAELRDAVDAARTFVTEALWGSRTWSLGAGHGPLDHNGLHRP